MAAITGQAVGQVPAAHLLECFHRTSAVKRGVRRHDYVLPLEQTAIGKVRLLGFQYVQAGGTNETAVQCTDERRFVHAAAAGGVQKNRMLRHLSETRVTEIMRILRCQVHMVADNVRLPQKRIGICQFYAQFFRLRRVGVNIRCQYAHSECSGPLRDRAPDFAEAE